MRGVIRRFPRTDELGEDLAQEVLLSAYRAELHLEHDRDPWPWLGMACRNLAIDAGRRREVKTEDCVDKEVLLRLVSAAEVGGGPEELAVMRDGELADALFSLSDRYRRVLVMKYVGGWTYQELAEREGVSHAALRSAPGRARRRRPFGR